MPDTPVSQVSNPFEVYASAKVIPAPPAGQLVMKEITNTTTGATISGGFLVIRDTVSPPFTPWYDAVLLLHACEGEIELEYDGTAKPMSVGDVAWVRSGSTVVFRVRGGTATLFYSVTPADWRWRSPDPSFLP